MAIFSVIDTTDGGDSGYEGFVKAAANWGVAETTLSAAVNKILKSGGAGVAPVMTTVTGTGAPVCATSPTLVTPDLGTPSAGVLTSCTGLPVAGGGTGRATGTTAYALIATGTTATGAQQTLAKAGATTEMLVGAGASALPVWTTCTGSGAPVRATSPVLVTPNIGTPSAGVLTSCTGLPVAGGGTGAATLADGGIICGNGTGAVEVVAPGATTTILVGGGAATAPVWTTATGSGSPVRATSPTLVTPLLGTPTSGNLNNCTLTAPQPIGETTPNSIRGTNKEVFFTATDTMDAAEAAGTVVSNYGMTDADMVLTLPAAAEGLSFVCVLPAVRAKYFRLTSAGTDKIYLSGTVGTGPGYAGVASGYATGSSCSVFTFKASDGGYDWFCIPLFGAWVAG